MNKQQLIDYIKSMLTAPLTALSVLRDVLLKIVDFITESSTDIIPSWDAAKTFNLDGTGDGPFSKLEDTSGRLRFFITKLNGNINHSPPTDPDVIENTWWKEIYPAAGSAIKEWAPGVYGSGLIIVYHKHSKKGPVFCKLEVGARPFNSVNIESEILAGKWSLVPRESGQVSAWKQPVIVTDPDGFQILDITAPLMSMNGVDLNEGNRILLRQQVTAAWNKIYRVNADNTLTADETDLEGAIVQVLSGDTYAGEIFKQVGSPNYTWEQINDEETIATEKDVQSVAGFPPTGAYATLYYMNHQFDVLDPLLKNQLFKNPSLAPWVNSGAGLLWQLTNTYGGAAYVQFGYSAVAQSSRKLLQSFTPRAGGEISGGFNLKSGPAPTHRYTGGTVNVKVYASLAGVNVALLADVNKSTDIAIGTTIDFAGTIPSSFDQIYAVITLTTPTNTGQTLILGTQFFGATLFVQTVPKGAMFYWDPTDEKYKSPLAIPLTDSIPNEDDLMIYSGGKWKTLTPDQLAEKIAPYINKY